MENEGKFKEMSISNFEYVLTQIFAKKKEEWYYLRYILNYNYMGVTIWESWRQMQDANEKYEERQRKKKEDADLRKFKREQELNNPEFKKWQKENEEPTRNITAEELNQTYEDYDRLLWKPETPVDINDVDLEVKAILERERKKQAWIRDQLSNSELARTSDPVVTTESGSQDSADLPKHSVDENLSSQETRSDQIVSKKKMELSKKLLWPKKYNTFISFLKEQYPDDKLTNTKIIQKVTDLQKEYNTSHTDKPLIPDGVMWSKTYNAIINPIS